MRRVWSRIASVSVFLTVVTAGAAWGHVGVEPKEVPAGGYEKLTITVPTEKEVPTTEIRVEVPDGFVVSGVKPVEGWEYELEEDDGVITAVGWSGGEIGPQEFQEFELQAQAPEEAGEYAWRAIQTYEDGSEVEWTGPADSEEPAPVVSVASGGTQDHHGAAEDGHLEDGHLPDTGGTNVLLIVGAGAILVCLATMVMLRCRAGQHRRGTPVSR